MTTDIIKVAYLNKISTRKDGKSAIYSKTLREVLTEQATLDKPDDKVFEDEEAARNYKSRNPGIFPIALPYESAAYTDDVFRYGHMVFIDIDTTELVDEVFCRSNELKARIPSLVAVWYSLRNKLHFAFLCPWQNNIEYAAYWELISKELIHCVGDFLGKDVADCWSKANDKSLSTCKHLMAAGFTKGYKWFDKADSFEVDFAIKQETAKKYEYRNIKRVTPQPYSLFTDKEVRKKWDSARDVKAFIKWCEKNRPYTYYTQDREYDYKIEMVDGVQYNVWRNDGTVHRLKISEGFKLSDRRKRHISAAAILAVSFCNATFEEALFSASRYYVENCVEYTAREDEKTIILNKVESAFANNERNQRMVQSTGFLFEKRQVVIDDHYVDGGDYLVSRGDKAMVRAAVKRSDRHKRFLELYAEGDTTAVMTMKMQANGYPRISEAVTYKVGCECGVSLDKPENKYKGRYDYKVKYKGKYKNAYDRHGKRTMVRVEDIDNVNLFPTKRTMEEYNYQEAIRCLENEKDDDDWLKEMGLE